MNLKKFFILLTSSALLLSAVSGCTSSGTASDSTENSSTQAGATELQKETETEPAETEPTDTSLPKDKEYSVLFIGNSYTYCNDMPEVIFQSICDAAGYNVKVDSVTRGGYYLFQFADSTDEYGSIVKNKLSANEYDFIVLQDQSGNPAKTPSNFISGARALVRKIERYTDSKIVFFETWGYKTGYHLLPTHGGDTATMEMKNRAAYTAMANSVGADVALVGVAFKDIFENTNIEIYDPDHSHPSKAGSVLAACTIFSTIFQYDVRDLNFNAGISRSDLGPIKEAAYKAAFEEHPVDKRFQIEISDEQ